MDSERDLYEAILSKFLLNLTKEEQEDPTRLSYHANKAFFYYLDQVLKLQPSMDSSKLRTNFLAKLKEYTPSCLKINPQQLNTKLQENKPVCGVIIFNRDQTKLLVIKVKGKYGFPKGKWNQNETPRNCAARQVQEQTGISLYDKIDPRIKIQFDIHGSATHFFVAKNVSESERLKIDRKEVDQVFWMEVEEVKRNLNLFAEKARIAWNIYEKDYYKKEMEEMSSSKYWRKDAEQFNYSMSPILNFKLDRSRIYSAVYSIK